MGRGSRRRPVRCAWCGREVEQAETGRLRKFCRQSCRQRAYEQRHAHRQEDGRPLPDGTVILTPAEAGAVADRMFVLRCLAEDVGTAVAERAGHDELRVLCEDLVAAARAAERLR